MSVATGRKKQRQGNRRQHSVLHAATASRASRRAERRKSLLRGLRIAVILLLLGGGIGGGIWAWHRLFTENDFFLIRQVEITTDGMLGAEHVKEYAGVQEGMNLFALSLSNVRESLMQVPVIQQVQVGRRLPDTLVIDVMERVSVARLGRPGAGTPLAVDAQKHVLGPSSVRASLPVILGVRDKGLRPGDVVEDPLMDQALEILDLCNQSAMRKELEVATIDLSDEEVLNVGLVSGEQVQLSLDGLEEKLLRLPVLLSVARDRGLELTVYDLTVSRNYVGRPSSWTDAGAESEP